MPPRRSARNAAKAVEPVQADTSPDSGLVESSAPPSKAKPLSKKRKAPTSKRSRVVASDDEADVGKPSSKKAKISDSTVADEDKKDDGNEVQQSQKEDEGDPKEKLVLSWQSNVFSQCLKKIR